MLTVNSIISPLIFNVLYPYLSPSPGESDSPAYRLAQHYRQKEGSVHAAIMRLIRTESVKSAASALRLPKDAQLNNIRASDMGLSLNALGRYFLRLRMIMAIASLCQQEITDEYVKQYLAHLMQGTGGHLPSTLMGGAYSAATLLGISGHINRPVNTLHPAWVIGLSMLGSLATEGVISYRLGQKAYEVFYLPPPCTLTCADS